MKIEWRKKKKEGKFKERKSGRKREARLRMKEGKLEWGKIWKEVGEKIKESRNGKMDTETKEGKIKERKSGW